MNTDVRLNFKLSVICYYGRTRGSIHPPLFHTEGNK